jgi:predicted Rossmann fold flavoprotein
MKQFDVIVVGGGAAGLVAAGKAAKVGAKVILLEKNSLLGKKLLITGKGRCNLTNAGEIDELIDAFGSNGSFLYSAFYTFSNLDTINFFKRLGLRTVAERGKRVFPESEQAKDVVDALQEYVQHNKVTISLESSVEEILINSQHQVIGVRLITGQQVMGKRIIMAVGGASYPGTGSTGDGYRILGNLGHNIIPIKPALVPLETEEKWVGDLQGLGLKNVELSVIEKGKKTVQLFGEMLFTHFGISGPVVLTISKDIARILEQTGRPVAVSIDLKPALTDEKLDLRIQRDFTKYARKIIANSLGDLLPKTLIPIILMAANLDGEKFVHQISREERKLLVATLKNLNLTVTKTRPLKEAIVTAGGVDLKEINPGTMESKKIQGLFIVGELLDLDGITGGFNLQAAFSTGFVAGMNAAGGREDDG